MYWFVEIVPIVFPNPVLKMLMPSCFSFVRSMLAKRTLRRICGSEAGTLTLSRFTTLPAVEAIVTARSELFRLLTVPRKKITPLSWETLTFCPGNSALNSRRIPSSESFEANVLGLTVTLKNCRPPL